MIPYGLSPLGAALAFDGRLIWVVSTTKQLHRYNFSGADAGIVEVDRGNAPGALDSVAFDGHHLRVTILGNGKVAKVPD